MKKVTPWISTLSFSVWSLHVVSVDLLASSHSPKTVSATCCSLSKQLCDSLATGSVSHFTHDGWKRRQQQPSVGEAVINIYWPVSGYWSEYLPPLSSNGKNNNYSEPQVNHMLLRWTSHMFVCKSGPVHADDWADMTCTWCYCYLLRSGVLSGKVTETSVTGSRPLSHMFKLENSWWRWL